MLVALIGCTAPGPPPTTPASTGLTSSQSEDPTTPWPPPRAALEQAVVDEAISAPSLKIPIDARLVWLTRDDFLSGHRREAGREIVAGGVPPYADFWFVIGDRPDVASAAWVELGRAARWADLLAAGFYAYPTQPMADLIEIVDPSLSASDMADLYEQLRIGESRILHRPQTDITVEVDGTRYHVVADVETIYLVATRSSD